MEQEAASHRTRGIHLYRTKSVFHKYASFKIQNTIICPSPVVVNVIFLQ